MTKYQSRSETRLQSLHPSKRNPLHLLGAAAFAGALIAPQAGRADTPVDGTASLYYSYATQKIPGSTGNPGGSGVGIATQINIHRNFFIDGLYQYNNEHLPGADVTTSFGTVSEPGAQIKLDQVRAGGGVQYFVPQTPLTVYGKVDYVHYGYNLRSAGTDYGTDNDDGPGYFAGIKANGPLGGQLYAEGGYLDLSDSHGQEGFVGGSLPVGRFLSYHSHELPVQWYLEYRWSHLGLRGLDGSEIDYEYRTGLRLPFGT